MKLQTGYVYHYAFAMLIGVAAMTVYWSMFAGAGRPQMTLTRRNADPLGHHLSAARRCAVHCLSAKGTRTAMPGGLRSVTLFTFIVSLVIWIDFDHTTAEFQFVEAMTVVRADPYKMGVDGISMLFVVLTTFLMPLCILASWESVQKRVKEYMIAFLLLETMMIGVFCALDLFFYMFFEAGLIPMFIIIGVWGGARRVYASFKFFLYTLLGSVLMLVAMMAMYWQAGTTDIVELLKASTSRSTCSGGCGSRSSHRSP
jgi:NADH:ubiquinone oxidoreductase subunit 4 (subunit M)